jgi:hypothetical protein
MLCIAAHNRDRYLTDTSRIYIDSQKHLHDGVFHSTTVQDVSCELNKVRVKTRSGSQYCFTVALNGHGKAEWEMAKRVAADLHSRLAWDML